MSELESETKEALARVKRALKKVRGNAKAVSLLQKISSTLQSVLDKLSTLTTEQRGGADDDLATRSSFLELVDALGFNQANKWVNALRVCSDYANEGFRCVHADDCDENCNLITDGGNVPRNTELGSSCKSDKMFCFGFEEVCCKSGGAETTASLVDSESELKEGLREMRDLLREVRGEEERNVLRRVSSSMQSVLSKISALLPNMDYDELAPFNAEDDYYGGRG